MASNLEQLKAENGGKCNNCRRLLRPTDEDWFLCNECWQLFMQHKFVEDDGGNSTGEYPDDADIFIIKECLECGEPKDDPIHTIKVAEGKCPNCGGIIFQGDPGGSVHIKCWDEFKEYLEAEAKGPESL